MKQTMITLSKCAPQRGAEVKEKPVPEIGEDDILVKVLATSICGTDVHIYQWDAWSQSRIKPPQTMGHEFAGRVVKVGTRVKQVSLGDIVTAETHIVCNECEFCRSGNAHICQHTSVLGVDRDGAFAEYIAIPATNAIKANPSTPVEYLSVLEPLGNAVHTVLAQDVVGKSIAVVGCGPIGIMAVDVAKAAGASLVIAVDLNDYRLALAEQIGADACINPKHTDIIETVKSLTQGLGVDVVCEMSGNPIAIKQALSYLKYGGHMAMLGVPSQEVSINIANDIVFKGITIYGVTGRKMYSTWHQSLALVQSNKLHLDKIVTHVLPFEKYEDGFALMESGNCGKVVLTFKEEE